MSDWQTSQRGGIEFQWRWCDCDEWVADARVPIQPGTRHVRERVPNTTVELCYYADEATHTITMLKGRTVE